MSIAKLIFVWFEPDYVIGLCDVRIAIRFVVQKIAGRNVNGMEDYLRTPRIIS